MKILLLFILIIFSHNLNAQDLISKEDLSNPFDFLKFDSVVVYRKVKVEGQFDKLGVLKKGEINVVFFKRIRNLELKEVHKLIKIITDTNTYGGDVVMCFESNIGVVFYQSDNIIGSIDFSLSCNQLNSSFFIPAEHYFDFSVGKYEGDELIMPMTGFSDKGEKKIKYFFKKIK